ncbi:noggin-like [Cimex lectularius]|uniref:Noggin n=1 Tax=Cimex lectularius TaxID=79782 RepID=A0A8I6RBV6_CIMLE|nr:noggin-like [Cimex lectularius]
MHPNASLRLLVVWIFLLPSVRVHGTSPDLLLVPRDSPTAILPLSLWANPRQAIFRPRKRDLHQSTLLAALQPHYEPQWMCLTKPQKPPSELMEERASKSQLSKMADKLPLSTAVKEWLVSRATCPVGYEWRDLGSDFWPRWVRVAMCLRPPMGTCSWPPGMSCVSGPPRHLHVLRWHCRLRKNTKRKKTNENNVWGDLELKETTKKPKKRRRRKYRCLWVKVPYPVPEDCICACS